MNKRLVAYFSASGVTARVAKTLAEAAGADLFEIKPAAPYTNADLDWTDKKSRSSVEMNDPTSRPAISGQTDIGNYGAIFLGFPIWWYTAPSIIQTFLEQYDFSGKTIILFATSGGSGLDGTAQKLQALCPGATIKDGKLLNGRQTKETLATWVQSLAL